MTSDDICANCGQDIAYGCGCTERVRFKAELAAAQEEIERLQEALEDIESGRGMFGVDTRADLIWAMEHARAALWREG